MPNFGIAQKPAPVEKDSPLLGYLDSWIEYEATQDLSDGSKVYTEETFETAKDARKFQADIQLAARQRDRGFRTTKFVALDSKGKELPRNEDGTLDEDKGASFVIGGTLGERKKRNGTAKLEAETAGNVDAE